MPYHWGRYRGLAQDMGRPPLKELLLNNVFFDTCVYHQPGIELLLKVIPVDNILFASEMVGAVRGIDPETGHYYDDTKRYIDSIDWLSAADREKIFHGNARQGVRPLCRARRLKSSALETPAQTTRLRGFFRPITLVRSIGLLIRRFLTVINKVSRRRRNDGQLSARSGWSKPTANLVSRLGQETAHTLPAPALCTFNAVKLTAAHYFLGH